MQEVDESEAETQCKALHAYGVNAYGSNVAGSCGGLLLAPSGQLTSPNYPDDYDNNLDCFWNITIPFGIITLNFTDVYTESCIYDWLKVLHEVKINAKLKFICTSRYNVFWSVL